MKSFTFNRQLLLIMFMLLNCFTSYASDDNLITKQTIVNLTEAGTLQNKIAYSEKYLITNLKIIGEINGTDLCLIRDMAGSYVTGEKTPGKLSILDLSETKIVEGGDYYYTDYFEDKQYTKNDTLGNWTFAWCKSLTTVIIPTSIAAIGRGTFSGCSNLATIDIPSNVTEIGSSAFVNCSSLKSMNIPSSVKSIGGSAFYGCTELTSIYMYSTEFLTIGFIGDDAFKGCNANNCTVYVPKGTLDAYSKSKFNYFKNIVEFEATSINKATSNGVKEISRYNSNGQQLTTPTKGINVIKYSDGSIRKVIVK